MKAFWIYIILIASIILTSCLKDEVKEPEHPLVGSYFGTFNTHTWMMGSGAYDSTYQETVNVLDLGDTVEVFGIRMHEDSLILGESYYYGAGSNYFMFEFRNDSLFMSRNSGGLGGGFSANYAGKKI